MRTFKMVRNADESGVSGIGEVLEGVEWTNGWITVCWKVPGIPSSVAYYPNFAAFERIHITSHPANKTEIEWNESALPS